MGASGGGKRGASGGASERCGKRVLPDASPLTGEPTGQVDPAGGTQAHGRVSARGKGVHLRVSARGAGQWIAQASVRRAGGAVGGWQPMRPPKANAWCGRVDLGEHGNSCAHRKPMPGARGWTLARVFAMTALVWMGRSGVTDGGISLAGKWAGAAAHRLSVAPMMDWKPDLKLSFYRNILGIISSAVGFCRLRPARRASL